MVDIHPKIAPLCSDQGERGDLYVRFSEPLPPFILLVTRLLNYIVSFTKLSFSRNSILQFQGMRFS